MNHKRRFVKMIAAEGRATFVDEDGKQTDLVFNGGDVTLLWEHAPSGRCQRCGHDHHEHGTWDWDGEDEYWRETPCQTCDLCEDWQPFTPWNAYAVKA